MSIQRSHSERTLELERVIEIACGHCETDLGAESLRNIKPLFDRAAIERRIALTAEAVHLLSSESAPVYSNARHVAEQVKAAGKGSSVPPDQLFRIAETLGAMARLRKFLSPRKEECKQLWSIGENLAYLPELQQRIEESIGARGEILDTASRELKRLRGQRNQQQKRIVDKLQSLVSGAYKTYLQEPIYTQREGRFVVPVKAQYRGKVPGIVHDASGSGQTIFVEPEPLVGEMNKLREIEAAEADEVERILSELSKGVGEESHSILAGMEALGELDSYFARARYAFAQNANKPSLRSGSFIEIVQGHHPLLERETSVALTVAVGGAHKSLMITGPNTGGKTVCLKLIGLYSLMICCGFFLPAQRVEFGPFAGVWADIGDEQSIQQSLSTFSAHLKNISRIFQNAKRGTLALFDEIGAGTDPREGAALGKAIISSLIEKGVTIACSTHYGELKAFALSNPAIASAAMEFDLHTLRPTYHLVPGAAGASHALEISRRYGLPKNVVDLAGELLGEDALNERKQTGYLDKLVAEAKADREAAAKLKHEVQNEKQELERKLADAKEKIAKARERGAEQVESAIREAREKYRDLLARLSEQTAVKREELISEAKEIEEGLKTTAKMLAPESTAPSESVEVGMDVSVRGHSQVGKVAEIKKNGVVVVMLNNVKLSVARDDVTPVVVQKPKARPSVRKRNLEIERTQGVSGELMLRHMSVESALEALEGYFDDAALAGITRARIVHGKGDGILRKVVREFLTKRKDVKSYSEAAPEAGGSGVTVVEFKT